MNNQVCIQELYYTAVMLSAWESLLWHVTLWVRCIGMGEHQEGPIGCCMGYAVHSLRLYSDMVLDPYTDILSRCYTPMQTSNEKAVTEYGWEIKGLGLLNDVVKGSYVQQ